MVDNNLEFLYYIVSGKLYKKQDNKMGVLRYEEKRKGEKGIIEYRGSAVQRIILQLFGKS